MLSDLTIRNPLCTVVPQFFAMPVDSIGRKITAFLCSSLIQSVQSLEVDDNCIFVEILAKGTEGFSLATRLTHLRIGLWNLFTCIDLLNHIGSQLQSFTVTVACVSDYDPPDGCGLRRVSLISLTDISIDLLT